MYRLFITGAAHSQGIVLFYLVSALLLTGLQAWWFVLIAKAALGFGMSTDARDEKKKK